MGLAIFLLAVGSTSAGVYYYYTVTYELVFNQMRSRMRDLAHLGTNTFTAEDRRLIKKLTQDIARDEEFDLSEARGLDDGDTLESLTKERADYYHQREDYQRIVQVLRKIRAGGRAKVGSPSRLIPQRWPDAADQSRIKYAYILVPMEQFANGVTQKYLADSDWEAVDMNGNGKIDEDETPNPIGNLYKTDDLIFPRALDGVLGTSDAWYTDRWGTFLSSAAPILDENGQVIGVLGLDLDVVGEANRLLELEQFLYTIIIASVLMSILVAGVLAFLLHRPIEKLRQGAERVSRGDFNTVVDVVSRDELGLLATTFNDMVAEIRDFARNMEQKVSDRTAELKATLDKVQDLKNQQDGDYYLTTLLADPLFRDWNKSQNVETRFLLRQKKRFQFRKWPGELGGDLCVSGNLRFAGPGGETTRYTMFCNADAMGKSMQGAGGAIVMGTVLNSIMHRSAAGDRVQTITPETWLRETFVELQSVFEAFDGSMSCSAFLGLIEDGTGLVHYFNAEHPFTILYRNGKASFFQEEIHLRKIGMPQLDEFTVLKFQLEPGDVLIAGSDGRDDIRKPDGIINEDESQILRVIEATQADLDKVVATLESKGELTDDLSLFVAGYGTAVHGGQDGSANRVTINRIAGMVRQKRYEEALSALEQGPPNAGMLYYYYRGMCLFKLGRATEALEFLEKAAAMNRDQVAVPDLLGRVYYRLGRTDDAKRYWEDALKLNPRNEKIKAVLAKISAQAGV